MTLEVRNLNLSFRRKILSNVSFEVANGSVLGIIGPSGSGKTSLLKTIAGLIQPDSGQIFFNGKEITHLRTDHRNVRLALQNPALFDLTVRENVEFAIDDPRTPAPRRKQLADITMSTMNIIGLADRSALQLSGGQAQRVSLARTLASEPKILLLDEPLAHLELSIRESIHTDLLNYIRRFAVPTIYVTHDLEDAFALADQIAVLNSGEIIQTGSAEELFFHPNSLTVAQMLGMPNSFTVNLTSSVNRADARCTHKQTNDLEVVDVAVEIGRAMHIFQAKTPFSGQGIAFIAPNNVLLKQTEMRSVFGLTGKILRRRFARSHWVYHVETEFGTTVSWQHELFETGDYVDLELLSGWVIPS